MVWLFDWNSFLFLCLYDKMCRIKKIFHGKQILAVGSLWADPLANLKQLVNSFISLLARNTGKGNWSFRNRSFRYEFKQWNCAKILISSSKVCNWTRKIFWVNILCSLSQLRETVYTSKELTCIETTGNPSESSETSEQRPCIAPSSTYTA